jgi:hypothetical protein
MSFNHCVRLIPSQSLQLRERSPPIQPDCTTHGSIPISPRILLPQSLCTHWNLSTPLVLTLSLGLLAALITSSHILGLQILLVTIHCLLSRHLLLPTQLQQGWDLYCYVLVTTPTTLLVAHTVSIQVRPPYVSNISLHSCYSVHSISPTVTIQSLPHTTADRG